jgi:hypothetical protein
MFHHAFGLNFSPTIPSALNAFGLILKWVVQATSARCVFSPSRVNDVTFFFAIGCCILKILACSSTKPDLLTATLTFYIFNYRLNYFISVSLFAGKSKISSTLADRNVRMQLIQIYEPRSSFVV